MTLRTISPDAHAQTVNDAIDAWLDDSPLPPPDLSDRLAPLALDLEPAHFQWWEDPIPVADDEAEELNQWLAALFEVGQL